MQIILTYIQIIKMNHKGGVIREIKCQNLWNTSNVI